MNEPNRNTNFLSFDCKHCGQNNRINFFNQNQSNVTTKISTQNRKLPDGLEAFLLEFTIDILKKKPHDLQQFGYEYFSNKRNETTAMLKQIRQSFSICNSTNKDPSDTVFGDLSSNREQDEFEVEEDDESDHINDLHKFHSKNQTSRRVSVFSKTYDPDDDDASNNITNHTDVKHDLNQNEEDLANKRHELNALNKIGHNVNREMLKNVLLSIVLFKHLDKENIDSIVESMFERKCVNGEVIIREGDEGKYFYVIMGGSFDVYKMRLKSESGMSTMTNGFTNGSGFGRKVATIKEKGFFGELSLLYDQPRSATIICNEEGTLYCMNRDKFKRLAIGISFKRLKLNEEFVASLPLFQSMTSRERSQVADALTTIRIEPGECIFKQNEQPNGMYFIESGIVSILKYHDATESYSSPKKLLVGDYFGEVALINNALRSASAYADENNAEAVRLAFLDTEAFKRLIKDETIEIIKENMLNYENF